MKLTILGSGTFMPQIERAGPSYLLEVGGMNFIFDFGRGTIDRLLKSKFDLYQVDKIFITHTHIDHIAELLSYIQFVWDNPEKKKFKNNVVEIFGPEGFVKSMQLFLKGIQYDEHVHFNRIRFREFEDRQTIKFGNVDVKAFEVPHSEIRKCVAYRVTCEKKVFSYSGDGPKCDAFIDACMNADLALIEADLGKKWKLSHIHMDGEDAGEVATKSQVKHLILTHVADTYLGDVLTDLEKSYSGPVKIAKDLMEVVI